jgi:hypothetical protein
MDLQDSYDSNSRTFNDNRRTSDGNSSRGSWKYRGLRNSRKCPGLSPR